MEFLNVENFRAHTSRNFQQSSILKHCETLPLNILDDICLNIDHNMWSKLDGLLKERYVRIRPLKFVYISTVDFVCCYCLQFKNGERSYLECDYCYKKITVCWKCLDNEEHGPYICSWCKCLEVNEDEDEDQDIFL